MQGVRGRRIGLILQDPKYALNPVRRIGDQIADSVLVHKKTGRREARERALAKLEAVKIRNPARVYGLYPHEVSGGMGQRIMIAMTLVPDPELIVADEPTSALDVTVRLSVLAILDDLVSERGIGLVFISHDLTLVSSFCHRVAIMYAGRVVETCQAARLDDASHPYTRNLLAALPSMTHPRPRLPTLRRDPAWLGDALMAALVVDDLEVTFGSGESTVRAVKGVSFEVALGEVFGLVGESGCGKSTILRCLAGLNTQWNGRIVIDGAPVRHDRDRAFHKRVQMVFQDPYASLHPRLTINTQLMEPIRIHGMDKGNERVLAALQAVGLGPTFRFRYPHQLSGGQRQRVAVARALNP